MAFTPLKRGRKRIFNEARTIELANQGMTVKEITEQLGAENHDIYHYASVRLFLVNNNIPYKKGKIGRPKNKPRDRQ